MNGVTLPETIPEIFEQRYQTTPEDIASYHQDARTGQWVGSTWRDLATDSVRISQAYHQAGLRKGDRLAVLARTSRAWLLTELAGAADRYFEAPTEVELARVYARIARRLVTGTLLRSIEVVDVHAPSVVRGGTLGHDGLAGTPARRHHAVLAADGASLPAHAQLLGHCPGNDHVLCG